MLPILRWVGVASLASLPFAVLAIWPRTRGFIALPIIALAMQYMSMTIAGGGDITSADNKHAVFNSPAGVKALTYLTDMSVKDRSMYLDTTDQKYPALFWVHGGPPWASED